MGLQGICCIPLSEPWFCCRVLVKIWSYPLLLIPLSSCLDHSTDLWFDCRRNCFFFFLCLQHNFAGWPLVLDDQAGSNLQYLYCQTWITYRPLPYRLCVYSMSKFVASGSSVWQISTHCGYHALNILLVIYSLLSLTISNFGNPINYQEGIFSRKYWLIVVQQLCKILRGYLHVVDIPWVCWGNRDPSFCESVL